MTFRISYQPRGRQDRYGSMTVEASDSTEALRFFRARLGYEPYRIWRITVRCEGMVPLSGNKHLGIPTTERRCKQYTETRFCPKHRHLDSSI